MMSWSSADLSNQLEKMVLHVKSPGSITTRPDFASRAGDTWLIEQVSKMRLTLEWDRSKSSPEGRFKWLELVIESMDSVQEGSSGPSKINHSGLFEVCLSLKSFLSEVIVTYEVQGTVNFNFLCLRNPTAVLLLAFHAVSNAVEIRARSARDINRVSNSKNLLQWTRFKLDVY